MENLISKNKFFDSNKIIFSCLLLFALFYNGIWIFSGLDLTDTGFHLVKQTTVLENTKNVHEPLDTAFGSHLMGYLWNDVISKPSLIWNRVGYVLLSILTFIFSFLSLRHFFQSKYLIFPFIGTIVLTNASIQLIHYYTFPAFICVLLFYLYTKLWGENGRFIPIYSIMIGILMSVAILSRFPLITLFILPLLISIFFLKIEHPDRNLHSNFKKKIGYNHVLYTFLGIALSSILLFALNFQTGILNHYFQSINKTFFPCFGKSTHFFKGKNYSLSFHLIEWLKTYTKIIILMVIFAVGTLILFKILQKFEILKKAKNGLYLLIPLILLPIFLCDLTGRGSLMQGALSYDPKTGIATGLGPPALIILIYLSYLFLRKDQNIKKIKNFHIAFIVALLLMILIPLGSDTFAGKFQFGFWIVLPMSLALCLKIKENTSHSKWDGVFSRLAISAMGIILVLGIIRDFHGAYRDYSNRFKLNTPFNHPSLKYIHSSPERVKEIDNMLKAIEKYSKKGDRILCMGKTPLFYYLTERKPYIYAPWPSYLRKERFTILLFQNYKEFGFPKIIITTKFRVDDPDWPQTNDKYLEKKEHHSILEKFIRKNEYIKIWESKVFEIYSQSD